MERSWTLWTLSALVFIQIAVCGNTATAAPGITLLNEWHDIYGDARVGGSSGPMDAYNRSSTYDMMGGLPALYDSADVSDIQDGSFAHAASSADVFSLQVSASAWGGRADAHADAMWWFQPKWSTLQLCFNCFVYGTDPTFIELFDQTAGTSTYLWDNPYGPPEHASYGTTRAFGVDPSHVYTLAANLFVGARDDGNFYSSMNAAVVPAPSALLLGGLGAALVGCWRRSRRTSPLSP